MRFLSGSPLLLGLLRWRFAVLWVWLIYLVGRRPTDQGIDWDWFTYGVGLLFRGEYQDVPTFYPPTPDPDGTGGLYTYATEPRLHMGPLSLLAAGALIGLYPGDGLIGAALLMSALGPALVFAAERAAVRVRGLRRALDEPLLMTVTLLSGATFLFFWVDTAWSWGHLDEVLVISAAAGGLWFVGSGIPVGTGVAVGLAIGAKSSGVFLLPLLAGLRRRQALLAGAVAFIVAAASWLPFVVADLATIDAARGDAQIAVQPGSGAHALGLDLGPPPRWLRPLQTAVALGLAAVVVARGRWAAAFFIAVAARLATDPAIYPYLTAGLMFGALVWDLLGSRFPLPIWTLASAAAFHGVPRVFDDPDAHGLARVALAAAASAVALGAPKAWTREPRPSVTAATLM